MLFAAFAAHVPVHDTPARFAGDLRDERAMWSGFIRRNHITAER